MQYSLSIICIIPALFHLFVLTECPVGCETCSQSGSAMVCDTCKADYTDVTTAKCISKFLAQNVLQFLRQKLCILLKYFFIHNRRIGMA